MCALLYVIFLCVGHSVRKEFHFFFFVRLTAGDRGEGSQDAWRPRPTKTLHAPGPFRENVPAMKGEGAPGPVAAAGGPPEESLGPVWQLGSSTLHKPDRLGPQTHRVNARESPTSVGATPSK